MAVSTTPVDMAALARRADTQLSRLERSKMEEFLRALRTSETALQNEFARRWPEGEDLTQGGAIGRARADIILQQTGGLIELIQNRLNGLAEGIASSGISDAWQQGIDGALDTLFAFDTNAYQSALAALNVQGQIDTRSMTQAMQGMRDNLKNWTSEFIGGAQDAVIQSLVSGKHTSAMSFALAEQFATTRYKVDRVLRTELHQAQDRARREMYKEANVQYVQRVATQDERVCFWCAERAGHVYRIDEAPASLHPFDRCFNMPWNPIWAEEGLIDEDWVNEHARETKEAYNRQVEERRAAGYKVRVPEKGSRAPFDPPSGPPQPIWVPVSGFTDFGRDWIRNNPPFMPPRDDDDGGTPPPPPSETPPEAPSPTSSTSGSSTRSVDSTVANLRTEFEPERKLLRKYVRTQMLNPEAERILREAGLSYTRQDFEYGGVMAEASFEELIQISDLLAAASRYPSFAEVTARFQAYTDAVQSVLDQSELAVRANPKAAASILENGQFLSQFATGRSAGLLDQDVRALVERQLFGYPEDLFTLERPIYGYLTGDTEMFVEQYGDIKFILKESVRPRTTFTPMDSLDGLSASQAIWGTPEPVPSPLNSIEWRTLAKRFDSWIEDNVDNFANGKEDLTSIPLPNDLGDVLKGMGLYGEIQVHGQLKVEDIDRVIITKEMVEAAARRPKTQNAIGRITHLAEQLNIPVELEK